MSKDSLYIHFDDEEYLINLAFLYLIIANTILRDILSSFTNIK